MRDILHMGWPVACVLMTAIIGLVVVYIGWISKEPKP